jgi:hypothetical protein
LINGDGKSHGKTEILNLPEKNQKFILSLLKTHELAFLNFRYLYDNKVKKDQYFYFREFSNFAFSALSILGKTLNITVVLTKNK